MHFFTSVNNFYLAKARTLAQSIKKYVPDSFFTLILSDSIPEGFILDNEPFDELLTVEQLDIPVDNVKMWIYTHTVVELCTAVKGQALCKLLERSEKVVYIDPDITVFDDLSVLDELLDEYDIVFTPHLTTPEVEKMDVMNNEICALKHGSYNFGFFAVRATENGKKYASWYRDRLVDFCYDDKPNGLFTDQRWGDIAPSMFDNLHIWKHPGANVSTWNLTHREISKVENDYFVNGEPLLFYHFSGFDSGNQLIMLDCYSKGNPNLYELRDWYIDQINQNGQLECENESCVYNCYTDGTLVENAERELLRSRPDIQEHFSATNPYDKSGNSYYSWYLNEMSTNQWAHLSKEELIRELVYLYTTNSWKITKPLRQIRKLIRNTK